MKFIIHSLFILSLPVFFGACNKTDVYEQKTKTIDSLSGALNAMVNELSKTDTIVLKKSVARFAWYKQFIRQNINDTISKAEADNLQIFYTCGENLENFEKNRKIILNRAILMNSQLLKLAADIKGRIASLEEFSKYTNYEKMEAGKLIETGYLQQKLFHSGSEQFSTSLKGVELLIRTRNNGELPIIVKDSINL